MSKEKTISILKYVLGLGLGGVLLWLALRGIEFEKLKGYFVQANYLWVALALVVALLSHWFRAVRWKMLIKAAGYESNSLNLFAAIMVGYMVNQAVPRAGEVTRVTFGSRTENFPLSVSFGTLVTDRIFDIICLGLLVLFIVLLQFEQINVIMDKAFASGEDAADSGGGWIKWLLIGLPVAGIALWLIFRRQLEKVSLYQRVMKFLKEMWQAVKSVRKMDQPVLFVVYTLAIWICYILMTYLAFWALPDTANLPFMFALTAFTMGGIGMVFPSPGGIGSYHFAIIMSFVAYAGILGMTEDHAQEVGTSIAFIIHTSQLVMMIAVGFLCYLFLVPKLRVAARD